MQEERAIAQLALPLAYILISPENFPSPSLSLLHLVHCTMLCLTCPGMHMCLHTHCTRYPYRFMLVPALASNVYVNWHWFWKDETLTEMILRAHWQRKERFVLDWKGGYVACATEI